VKNASAGSLNGGQTGARRVLFWKSIRADYGLILHVPVRVGFRNMVASGIGHAQVTML
jgi:hypothetical protein